VAEPGERWMLANRRYLGVSFAVSHATHLLAIFALGGWSLAGVVARAGVRRPLSAASPTRSSRR